MEYSVQTVLHIYCSNKEVASAGIVIVIVCRIQGAGKVCTLVVDIIGHGDLSLYCKILQTTLCVSFTKTWLISKLLWVKIFTGKYCHNNTTTITSSSSAAATIITTTSNTSTTTTTTTTTYTTTTYATTTAATTTTTLLLLFYYYYYYYYYCSSYHLRYYY